MGEVGRWALVFALIIIVYGIVAHLVAIKTKSKKWLYSGRYAVLLLVTLTTVASTALFYLLITGDFSYEYVATYSSSDMPTFYKISAFWGGNAGSLLLWIWILSIYTFLVTYSRHKDSHLYLPWVSLILLCINLFFAIVLNTIEQPFALSEEKMMEGNGLNPLLQNPGMAVHPVALYLGYIGFSVPFAYGIAALMINKADAIWLKVTRRWTLVSWLFLSIGIIYGSQWAYVELGWGGYWAWDPVENASFLPWLTATAFLHSAMVQEKKGMLKGWNISLISATFMLTIFGTLLTRSGVLWSVHAFANGPIGAYFLSFLGVVLIFSLYMIFTRWELLKAESKFESPFSKESSFLINNMLLVASAFTILLGTIFPVISESVTGNKVMVGAPYFNRVNVPIFLAIIFMMGVGPVLAWRRSSLKVMKRNLAYPFGAAVVLALVLLGAGVRNWMTLVALPAASFVLTTHFLEFSKAVQARGKATGEDPLRSLRMLFSKNRRRYGGYVAHLGVILLLIGLTGAGGYSVDQQLTFEDGESYQLGKYELIYRGLGERETKKERTVYGEFLVKKEGEELGVIRPEKVFYINGSQPTTEVSVISSYKEDLFVVLNGWIDGTEEAVVQIKVFPLITWVWYGGYVLIFGTIISLWPERLRYDRLDSGAFPYGK